MSERFDLPDLGEGLTEAEIVRWLVAEGDEVTLNQQLAEVETAKAVVELPSPFSGTVARLHHAVGDTVEVGEPLVSFGSGTDASAEPDGDSGSEDAPGGEQAEGAPNLVGYGTGTARKGRPARRARIARSRAEPAADAAVRKAAPHDAIADPPPAPVGERPRSTPPVRKHAKDLGIDLALVEAGGASGLITREDVDAFAARRGGDAGTAPAVAGTPPNQAHDDGARQTRRPIRGVRKATAQAMVDSAFTAPHVTTFQTVDVTETMRLVDSLRSDRALEGHRIGVTAVAAKAVCLALGRNPAVNSRWDGDAGEIVEYHYVNLGVAAATERGLIVPVITDADAMTLVELADALGSLTQVARAGRTTPAEMTAGTFSVTNFGVFGIEAGTPIITPGQAAILGLGAVSRRPWEHDGQIALRDVMTLSLSFDHRLVDGAEGSRFLMDVAGVLERPGRAMLLR